MGVEREIRHLEVRQEAKHAYCSHARSRQYFPDGERYSLEEGLRRMVAWAKGVGARQNKQFHAIEVRKRLPDSWQ